jgi:hypothetical protein
MKEVNQSTIVAVVALVLNQYVQEQEGDGSGLTDELAKVFRSAVTHRFAAHDQVGMGLRTPIILIGKMNFKLGVPQILHE